MTAGVALLVQGLPSSKRAISPHRGPLHSPGSLGCQAQAHTHLILIYDNHTRQVPLSFRKSGDPKPGTSWTRVCVKVVLPSSYRPWRRAYRYGPETGGSMRQSEQGPSRPAYMTPPTHAASSMCFAPASEVLDPPPDTSGGDVKGLHTAGLPRPKNQRARRAEESRARGGRGTSEAARSNHPHPSRRSTR